jgi:hypothetical protein
MMPNPVSNKEKSLEKPIINGKTSKYLNFSLY